VQSNDRHHVYKSLETDAELCERVIKDLGIAAKYWRYDLEHASAGPRSEVVDHPLMNRPRRGEE